METSSSLPKPFLVFTLLLLALLTTEAGRDVPSSNQVADNPQSFYSSNSNPFPFQINPYSFPPTLSWLGDMTKDEAVNDAKSNEAGSSFENNLMKKMKRMPMVPWFWGFHPFFPWGVGLDAAQVDATTPKVAVPSAPKTKSTTP